MEPSNPTPSSEPAETPPAALSGRLAGLFAKPTLGAGVVALGLLTIAVMFFVTVDHFNDAKDVVAVLGSVTGVVATIVTAFFGIQSTAKAGSDAVQKVADAGTASADKMASASADVAGKLAEAHDKAITSAAFLDPNRATEFLEALKTSTS